VALALSALEKNEGEDTTKPSREPIGSL